MLQAAVFATDHAVLFPLGDCCCDGVGVERNHRAPVDSYRLAADECIVFAHIAIGDCFIQGIGEKGDSGLAHHWYETAVECGEPQTFMSPAISYACGLGVV